MMIPFLAGILATLAYTHWRDRRRARRSREAMIALMQKGTVVSFVELGRVLDDAAGLRVVRTTVTQAEVDALIGTLEDGR